MKVVMAATEAQGFVKTGGLGDVIGSLPGKLAKLGAQIGVFLPKFEKIEADEMKFVTSFSVMLGWRNQHCGIFTLKRNGVTYYFIDNEYYFKRPTLYGYYDDGERFAFYCRAVLEGMKKLDLQADIIHCHDWHTALIPVMLHNDYRIDPFYHRMATVYTIHNLKYQGQFSIDMKGDVLDMIDRTGVWTKLSYDDGLNFMKGGILYADRVTTVSPTYMEEIQRKDYGSGLERVLSGNADKLSGILNGIDYELYDPQTDESLRVNYPSSLQGLEGKGSNKAALQRQFHFSEEPATLLIGMVTRLTEQKGVDLVLEALPEIMAWGVQLILIGSGEPHYEEAFLRMQERFQDQLGIFIGFDEGLARKIYAASDLFLMPSQFEPCGLSQMIAMRYLALPLVRETGGLADTVIPYNEFTNEGDGFSFTHYDSQDMLHVIRLAAVLYREKPEIWKELMAHAAKNDFSWERSAREYIKLYESIEVLG